MQRRTFLQSAALATVAASTLGNRYLSAAELSEGETSATIDAITGDAEAFSLSSNEVKDFAKTLRGRVLLPQSAGYESARFIQNRIFNKHPALIVQINGVLDIRRAVDFAREHRMLLAVKGGGHSFSGDSTCERGMMIDLAGLSGVRVDPDAKRAWAFGGSLLGQVDRETTAYGLVTPLGTVSTTGVGGLVTGGGFGRIGRRFGMAIDNLLSVDVVTADGNFVHASAKENPDLFWAVRGGGGNFGIVTMFEFQLHPMEREALGGKIVSAADRAQDALKLFAEYSVQSPPELDLMLAYSPRGATFTIAYTGDMKYADKLLDPIRKACAPANEMLTKMGYADVQRSGDSKEVNPDPRLAQERLLKNRLISGISPDLIKVIVDGSAKHRLPVSFWQGCGRPGTVKPAETAFPHRYATHTMVCGTSWKQGEDGAAPSKELLAFWSEMEPYIKGKGFYFNYAGTDAILDKGNYDVNLPRLVQVKNKYDPGNLFRLNANVPPAPKA